MSEGVVLSEPVRHWRGEAPTRSQVLEELARELAKRRVVYPKWIAKKVITKKTAEQWPQTPRR